MKKEIDISKCRKVPINKNDRFWMDTMDFLVSVTKSDNYPGFLISWVKEVLNILRDEKVDIFLVMPLDGCWGIYITSKDNYMFSYNDGENIYISYRLYKYLKEKDAYNLFAGLLLHEATESIMRRGAEKKGYKVDKGKYHGEAMRLEKALVGTSLSDLFIKLSEQELDRRKVTLDKEDLFVEGCAVSGEEIVTEIGSFKHTDESFILQLAPGQKRSLPYSGGYFNAQAEDFKDPFKLKPIDFKDYCNLMKILDDLFIEESVINGEGPFKELLTYIRGLDFTSENDNFLLRILWLFTERFYNGKTPRDEFLYNMYLLVDEYISYFIMRDVVKGYWAEGKFIKDNVEEVEDGIYEKKKKAFSSVLKDGITEWLIRWFSEMKEAPGFAQLDVLKWIGEIPHNITKQYKKITSPSVISDYKEALYIHREILEIQQKLRLLMNEPRGYRGIERGDDPRVCELKLIRVHFWKDKNIFTSGETVGVYTCEDETRGFAEVIDVKEYSLVIFLKDHEIDVPENGYIKGLEEEELSIRVSLEAINSVKRGGRVDKLL